MLNSDFLKDTYYDVVVFFVTLREFPVTISRKRTLNRYAMEKFKENLQLLRETDSNALVVRLERNQRDLMQMRSKLRSYRCEPRTYNLFERIEALRNAMERCSRENKNVIRALKEGRKGIGEYVDQAKRQLTEFRKLHSNVDEYLSNCTEGELHL